MKRDTGAPVGAIRISDEVEGYDLEGRDQRIGRVERVGLDGRWLLVSIGRLFRRRYLVPSSSVRLVDSESEALLVDVSKSEVDRSPLYDPERGFDAELEETLRAYYGGLAARGLRRGPSV